MCGIVAYFGGAGNHLTRVLTGMSAIIYRAPDSTGIGMFGDDREPIRLRKSLGSVVQLLEALRVDAVYMLPEAALNFLLAPRGDRHDLARRQQALLELEGFEPSHQGAQGNPPDFDALVDLENDPPARLTPGCAGPALFQPAHRIRSRKDLSALIQALIGAYDLSPLVIHGLIRGALAETIDRRRQAGAVSASDAAILAAFDDLFEATRVGARVKHLRRHDPGEVVKPPSARKDLWLCLIETEVRVPADYNRDGVCCLFRLLDAALLSRMAGDPALGEALERALDTMWLPSQRPLRVDWRTLYAAEKGLNVYGWAAAAALAYLQQDVYFPAATEEMKRRALMTAESMVPGQTDPQLLRYLATPIIAHGRWAMQSAVTVENAHPFMDARRQRALALNGQFDSRVEARLGSFLETVGGYRLRSGNSAEYPALLWGHFYDQFRSEQQRSDMVRQQVEKDMADIAVGSQAVDYRVVHRVRGRGPSDLDRMAFIAAARQIVSNGGQVAVIGISLLSPRQLLVASHNRPVFVVRRLANDDFMVVSDINAALGLFPQKLIEATINALDGLEKRRAAAIAEMMAGGATRDALRACRSTFAGERETLLAPFAVEVHPLDGEEILAVIETALESGSVRRTVAISDFDGRPLPDMEPFETRLDPVTVRRDVDTSFHETHLREIPERFRHILNVYSPDAAGAGPAIDLNTRVLRRRFGRRLEGLRRLILVGTGSSFHMAQIARPYLMHLLPDVAIDAMRPGDIEDPGQRMQPQQDLVIMLSWSATTAEMVQLAQQLAAERILMIGITEKCFADMALATAKSAGVMPVYSGEEVTIAGIKSTLCMLLCVDLLGAWLAAEKGLAEHLGPAFSRMNDLAGRIEGINQDEGVLAFCRTTAAAMRGADAIVVAAAAETVGIGREVALKLEEASWYSVGQCYAYDDILKTDPGQWSPGRFVIVHATQRAHIDAALAVIEKIAGAGIDLAVVTGPNRHQEQIETLSKGRCLLLPCHPDHSQAYGDIAFYYRLALDLGTASGHGHGEAPRNRTKSPTVTRSRSKAHLSPATELKRLEAATLPAVAVGNQGQDRPSRWETAIIPPESAAMLADLRGLAQAMGRDSFSAREDEAGLRELGRLLFDPRSEVNGLVAVSLDAIARAVVRDVSAFWRRLTGLPIRELPAGEWPGWVPDDQLVLVVAAQTGAGLGGKRPPPASMPSRIAWIGPRPPAWLEAGVTSAGRFVLPSGPRRDPAAQLHAGLHRLFRLAWGEYRPKQAAVVQRHAAAAAPAVHSVLNDDRLLAGLQGVAAANARYHTAFFISPFAGSGRMWEALFDRAGCLALVHHPPGQAGHGPIVTIDGVVDQKYVAMERREALAARYGEPAVARWEAEFLGGDSIDAFLARPPHGPVPRPRAPFYSADRWFLPVLQPDYDTRRDNLIVLDMTGERALPLMLDELSLLGSRAPRLVIITQEARMQEAGAKTLFSFPVSDLLILPPAGGGPIADMHLPLVLNAVGVALAAAWKGAPGV